MKTLAQVVMLSLLLGCSHSNGPIPRDIWTDISPYNERFDDGIERLKDLYKKDPMMRESALKFVDGRLNAIRIGHKDQLRLSVIVRCLMIDAQAKEQEAICDLISKGRSYPDFCAMVLSVKPPYILTSMEVLTIPRDVLYYGFNPDGGGTVRRVLQNEFVNQLRKATGKNFGRDYQKWKEWWQKEGSTLRYDAEQKRYLPSDGSKGPTPEP